MKDEEYVIMIIEPEANKNPLFEPYGMSVVDHTNAREMAILYLEDEAITGLTYAAISFPTGDVIVGRKPFASSAHKKYLKWAGKLSAKSNKGPKNSSPSSPCIS